MKRHSVGKISPFANMNSPPDSKFEDSDHSSEDKRRATKMKMRQED
jgi:hypothetical protein